jgi:hypothetical protein
LEEVDQYGNPINTGGPGLPSQGPGLGVNESGLLPLGLTPTTALLIGAGVYFFTQQSK